MPRKVSLTEKEFIDLANKANNFKYDYSLVEYVNAVVKVKVICKEHGVFLSRPSDHIRGHGCPKCHGTFKLTKEEFIEKSLKIHGDTYDYSNVIYNGNKVKVEIICKEHGAFLQKPNSHLSGRGCPKCVNSHIKTKDEFINLARQTHGDKYDYSLVEYNRSKDVIKIICKTHGVFEQIAVNHQRGADCPMCNKENVSINNKKSVLYFLEKANELHKDKYLYCIGEPVNNSDEILIRCDKHGVFKQKVGNHLSVKGCLQCGRDVTGWTRTKFTDLVARKGRGIVYILKLSNSSETFLKIGITTRTVKHRICDFPYDVEILHEEIFNNGSLMFDLEKYLHRTLKKYSYSPKIDFGGSTECFEILPMDVIFDKIAEFKNINKVD